MKNKQSGFTLIEVVVAVGISAVILMVATGVLFNLNIGFVRNINQITSDMDLQRAIDAIHPDLINAQEFEITGNETIMRWTDYTGNQTDHEVRYGFYGFNGTGTMVLWRIFDGTPQIVGGNITDLLFTTDNSTTRVRITSAGLKQERGSKTIEFSVKNRKEVGEE